jgi:hypothetical protein
MFEPSGFFYLYLYPIVTSIIAGFIFWLVFSFFPDKKRNRSFSLGIINDLIKLNNMLFHYFDLLMKAHKHSPSIFQKKIHSCSLSEDEINAALQNKILNGTFNYYPELSDRLICIGNELENCRSEIDETIKRLYSFNLYLSASQVQILRNIHEKIFRYSLKMKTSTTIGNMTYRPVDPSLSYMTKVLLELQEDYSQLRKVIFKNDLVERSFVISKIQRHFYSGEYKKCVAECDKWIKKFPFDSDLQISYKTQSLFSLGNNNLAYAQLELFLSKNSDVLSNRVLYYPLLSDSIAYAIILKKVSQEKIDEMKKVVENENLLGKTFLASNAELKQFYSAKKCGEIC